MAASLTEIIYCSRDTIADAEPVRSKISKILAAAKQNNKRDEITGALLYAGGFFAQLVEGPTEAIEQLFARISADPRHHEVVVLSRSKKSARHFGGWAMELMDSDDPGGRTEDLLAWAHGIHDQAAAAEVWNMLRRGVADARVWGTSVEGR